MGQRQRQELKNRLGPPAHAVNSGDPQHNTAQRKPAASEHPPAFNEILLDMPQDNGEFERLLISARRFES